MTVFVYGLNLSPFYRQVADLDISVLEFCVETRTWHTGERILREGYRILESIYNARLENRYIPYIRASDRVSDSSESDLSDSSETDSSENESSLDSDESPELIVKTEPDDSYKEETLPQNASTNSNDAVVENPVYVAETDESYMSDESESSTESTIYVQGVDTPYSPPYSPEEFNPSSHSSPIRNHSSRSSPIRNAEESFQRNVRAQDNALLALVDHFEQRLIIINMVYIDFCLLFIFCIYFF